jgi:hypothetical protein
MVALKYGPVFKCMTGNHDLKMYLNFEVLGNEQ